MIERTDYPQNESVHAAVPLEMRVARDGKSSSDSAFFTEVKMCWLKTKSVSKSADVSTAVSFSPVSTDTRMHTSAFYITTLNTCVEGKTRIVQSF